MQRATCTGIRIRSPSDARIIFHAVLMGILPMVTRRLDTEERSLISPGSVYVWEERGPQAELTGVGIERWTDGIRWGPSRVREGFLFYHEKQAQQHLFSEALYDSDGSSGFDPAHHILIKQTYTVFVDTTRGQRKWHLIAYFTEDSIKRLRSVDDIPHLRNLLVPHGKYKSARSAKGRPDHIFNPESEPRNEYVPYESSQSPVLPPSASSPQHHPLSWPDSPSQQEYSPSSPRHIHYPRQIRRGPGSSGSSDDNTECLAPLEYLQNIQPPRRHPMDEKALMCFSSSPGRL